MEDEPTFEEKLGHIINTQISSPGLNWTNVNKDRQNTGNRNTSQEVSSRAGIKSGSYKNSKYGQFRTVSSSGYREPAGDKTGLLRRTGHIRDVNDVQQMYGMVK